MCAAICVGRFNSVIEPDYPSDSSNDGTSHNARHPPGPARAIAIGPYTGRGQRRKCSDKVTYDNVPAHNLRKTQCRRPQLIVGESEVFRLE
jgi:hypothetical protein